MPQKKLKNLLKLIKLSPLKIVYPPQMHEKESIQIEHNNLQVNIPSVSMPDRILPDGYFDHLLDDIMAEIHTNAFLTPFTTEMPFTLPTGYFDSFSDKLISDIQTEQFIDQLPKQLPYEVPQAYFDQMPTFVVDQIKNTHFVESLPKQVPYDLPVDYFEQFPKVIITKTQDAKSLQPLRVTRTLYSKIAMAASLLIILSLGFLFITQPVNHADVETQLAQISDADINTYIQKHAYEFESHLTFQSIDESKIDLNKLENDIYNAYFDNITDDEINQFL